MSNASGEAGQDAGWSYSDERTAGNRWTVVTSCANLPVPRVSTCWVSSFEWCTSSTDVPLPETLRGSGVPVEGHAPAVVTVSEWICGTGPDFADLYELIVGGRTVHTSHCCLSTRACAPMHVWYGVVTGGGVVSVVCAVCVMLMCAYARVCV